MHGMPSAVATTAKASKSIMVISPRLAGHGGTGSAQRLQRAVTGVTGANEFLALAQPIS
jgi:hypothetical protein